MPIVDVQDAREVERALGAILEAADGAERLRLVRRLFVETLDFDEANQLVSLESAGHGQLPADAHLVARRDGVTVAYIPLAGNPPESVGAAPANTAANRVTAAAVLDAARILAATLNDQLLLAVSNRDGDQLHLISPDLTGSRPRLQRLVAYRGQPRRTVVQQIANLWQSYGVLGKTMGQAIAEAFSVEPVTKEFFDTYRSIFNYAKSAIDGFGGGEEETGHVFTQTLFNRLMFVYFLSRKGWLKFNGETDYLNALWRNYGSLDGDHDFYTARLRPLFFAGLNNPQSRNVSNNPGVRPVIGDVPFLNGGLFEETDLDKRGGITVPDAVIQRILTGLFDKFNFTVMESTPFDIEVAVDPEMLGKVFEELVTGRLRHDSGAYYTPRPVVSFMCREALKGYLEGRDTGAAAPAIAALVDRHDTGGLGIAQARSISRALEEVTVVDPACGSGAYLLGMMQELIELQNTLYNVGVDAKSLYDLKLEIIRRNLYGVDLDGFAVNIAMLRLWLSLAIDYEGDDPQPLPNLDFKVLCGDSLLGPDPSAGVEVQGTLGQDMEQFRRLGRLKGEYMRASDGNDKDRLRGEILQAETAIREALGAGGADRGVIDWRVEFAEVFAESRGFDVAIANPPYIQLQGSGGLLANRYKDAGYQTFARTGDIYQLFYERGCQILKEANGLLAYITSNSWLRAEYGKATRRYFANSHRPQLLLELGKDVFESAIVDSGVLMLRTGGDGQAFPAVDMDRSADKAIPPAAEYWGQVRPDGDGPWSILSATEQSVLGKMREKGTPVKDWDVTINRGVLTGLNGAFIIDDATRQRLIEADPKSAEIIKPILRGRDIRRFRVGRAGQCLIATHNGYGNVPAIDIEDYPAVKAHLDRFSPRLEKRLDKGSTPYNLRNCTYYGDFDKEKLFWMDMSPEGRFAYVEAETFCNDKAFLMTGASLKYLCAVLNSTLVTWFMQSSALTTGMGLTQWKKFAVERIPIPKISAEEQEPFIGLVDEILAAKSADATANTEPLEWQLDRLVYDLYGLTEEEDTAIERSLGLIHQTDEEEDAALGRMMEGQGPYGPEDLVSREEVMRTLRGLRGS